MCSSVCGHVLPGTVMCCLGRSCAAWDDNNKDNVCKPNIPAGIECPPPSKTISPITRFEANLTKPQKGSRAHRSNSEAESQTKYTIPCIGVPKQVKLNLKKMSPLPYEARECSSSGSRRPGHPHSTPWSCEKGKTKLTTHITGDNTLCTRQYLHAPLLC